MSKKSSDYNFINVYGFPPSEYRVRRVKNMPRGTPRSWMGMIDYNKNEILIKRGSKTQEISRLIHEGLHANLPMIEEFWVGNAERHIMDSLIKSGLVKK